MNAILLVIALWCSGSDSCNESPRPSVRDTLEQRLYEDGYQAQINVRYWGVVASRDEARFSVIKYACVASWIVIVIVLAYSVYADRPGLFFGTLVPSLFLTALATIPAANHAWTSNTIQDRWRVVAHKCDRLQQEMDLSPEEPSDRTIDRVNDIADEILEIENDEPPMDDPEADRELLAKCQNEQNIAQGSVKE